MEREALERHLKKKTSPDTFQNYVKTISLTVDTKFGFDLTVNKQANGLCKMVNVWYARRRLIKQASTQAESTCEQTIGSQPN